MKKKLLILCILFTLLFSVISAYSQSECGTTEICTVQQLVERGGFLKPERTDKSNGQNCDGTFKMLFVFVQFQGEDPNSETDEWPIGGPPNYLNNLFSENKNYTGNYWDRYSRENQFLSDYYMEVSRGILDVTGITRNVILDHTAIEYRDIAELGGYNGLLRDIYDKLVNHQQTIDWESLDQWRRNNTTGLFEKAAETYIDMMGIFFRTVPITGLIHHDGSAGYAGLEGPNYQLPNGKFIGNNLDYYGTGFICRGKAASINEKMRNIGIGIHEIGHFLFGPGHSASGIMTARGGLSVNDLFYSGFERYKLGYTEVTGVDYHINTYQLDDISGREGTSNLIMKVPIPPYNAFFLIESRRKISEYDIYMLGDTAGFDTFIDAKDKGKGVYIYHAVDLGYPSNVDIECADGLWNWTKIGYSTPDWSPTQLVDLIVRTSIPDPVQNDMSIWDENNTNKDGVSANQIYFTWGNRHIQPRLLGTVIIYTNTPDWYTSRETWGDRYDAWNLGYNEIFSPYSNPNTKDAYHIQTGIFIYYDGLINNKANIHIYKVGEPIDRPMTLEYILEITPPSKPMGIKMEEDYPPNTSICNPKIVWNHNIEPDMINNIDGKKYYKVYRAYSNSMDIVPNDFLEIAIVSFLPIDIPNYVDVSINKYDCSHLDRRPYGTPFPVRYYVKAMDNTQWLSVPSDFVATQGITPGQGIDPGDGDHIVLKNVVPKIYDLVQNYPNPFNPVTNIKYDLPKDIFVSVKIYDLLGREIKTLVNEFKNAGSYIVTFDGSEFSSGIYFYRITAGDFVSVKRMILIK
jgi:hypothetical protein